MKAIVVAGLVALTACSSAPKSRDPSFTMRLAETESLDECLKMVNDIDWYGWADYVTAGLSGLNGDDYASEKAEYVEEQTRYYERFCAEIHEGPRATSGHKRKGAN